MKIVDSSIRASVLSRFLPLICLLTFLSSCSLPKDPKVSWQKAKDSALKVGVVSDGTSAQNGADPGDYEAQLIRSFATVNGLQVEYAHGSESELIRKMENFELHLITGKFEKKTEWRKKVGTSICYDDGHVILVAPGENRLLFQLDGFIHGTK